MGKLNSLAIASIQVEPWRLVSGNHALSGFSLITTLDYLFHNHIKKFVMGCTIVLISCSHYILPNEQVDQNGGTLPHLAII